MKRHQPDEPDVAQALPGAVGTKILRLCLFDAEDAARDARTRRLVLSDELLQMQMLFRKEDWHSSVNPSYMASQKWQVDLRPTIVEFLIEACACFRYDTETASMAMSYFDRYLSAHSIDAKLLQPLSAASLLIAVKYNENWDMSAQVAELADRFGCDAAAILNFEKALLRHLNWSVGALTAPAVIHQLVSLSPRNQQRLKRYSELFSDLLLCETSGLSFSPVISAVASVSYAAKTLLLCDRWLVEVLALLSLEARQQVGVAVECINRLYKPLSDRYKQIAPFASPKASRKSDLVVSPCCVVTNPYTFSPIEPAP
mmetsp:Transcript_6675/g.15357  ORF Transcript_6675/g.15357 Transcript_6675/m.15357 type:complete len:314 (+) Transcript_6675:134-1075(+)|eukprot:CAMPEP_0114553982 /NCGR_PEP_ID=MMETSP0114-20121206/7964_1 /TAXON_ID=31324 /ORGANISM="Goniomonas sp, Strain m" /LENGTH=313 /DNA_ID=CAMNT_0001738993 /DNA_START=62 /DNA_END=1003 /DNA_ORIENTATION=+